jgi:hypothetical protein
MTFLSSALIGRADAGVLGAVAIPIPSRPNIGLFGLAGAKDMRRRARPRRAHMPQPPRLRIAVQEGA